MSRPFRTRASRQRLVRRVALYAGAFTIVTVLPLAISCVPPGAMTIGWSQRGD